MESKVSVFNRAMSRQLRAERNARPDLTMQDISAQSGITVGTLNRIMAKSDSDIRDVNITQIIALARVFGIAPAELVEAAERRAGRMTPFEPTVKPVSDVRDDLSARRRKQAEAEAMTPEELDNYEGPIAATRDPEMDSDEPEHP